jgi:hypothetical protein
MSILVFYFCKTFLSLGKQHEFDDFESKEMRKTFEFKIVQTRGDWKIFRNINSSNVYSSEMRNSHRGQEEKIKMDRQIRFGKGKAALSLINHHAMKTYGGVEVQLHTFLRH